MNKDQFMQDLLAAAKASGIAEAEAFFQQADSMRIMARKGAIEEYAVNTTGGLSLRGLVHGKMGTAYTEALDEDAIQMLVQGVIDSATLITDADAQFIFAGSSAYQAVDTIGDLGSAQARIDKALALEKAALSQDEHVKELGFTFLQTEHETVKLMNTHGVNLSHTADACIGYTETTARKEKRVTTGQAVGLGLSLTDVDVDAIAKEAVAEAVALLDAKPIPSGSMPVIFRNTAMGELLGAFSEVFSADAAQKGLSLLAGKEGEMIASPAVTLVDDPLMPGSFYSRGFDAEGVATYTKNIVEGGKLTTLMHNLKTANKAGVSSTGNAARRGYSGPIGVAPRNFYFQPGSDDLMALEAEMQNGLVVTSVQGLHAGTNAISGDFSLLSRGYLVENGKRTQPVEQITVAGNFFDMLKAVRKVGSDLKMQMDTVFSPSVWVDQLSIAGESAE